jgi:hypothetical protein
VVLPSRAPARRTLTVPEQAWQKVWEKLDAIPWNYRPDRMFKEFITDDVMKDLVEQLSIVFYVATGMTPEKEVSYAVDGTVALTLAHARLWANALKQLQTPEWQRRFRRLVAVALQKQHFHVATRTGALVDFYEAKPMKSIVSSLAGGLVTGKDDTLKKEMTQYMTILTFCEMMKLEHSPHKRLVDVLVQSLTSDSLLTNRCAGEFVKEVANASSGYFNLSRAFSLPDFGTPETTTFHTKSGFTPPLSGQNAVDSDDEDESYEDESDEE